MNRFKRFVAASLSLSLILASAPYQAAAQTVSARVIVPIGPLGAAAGAAGAFGALGGANVILPSASLQTGLVPSLTPTAALTPVLSAPAAIVPLVGGAHVLVTPSALKLVATPAASVAITAAGKTDSVQTAVTALQTGANTLTAAAKSEDANASRVALDGLFEGSAAKQPEALSVAIHSAPADSEPNLTPSDESRTPGFRPEPEGPSGSTPKTSIKRTLSVGFLAAVIPIAFTMAAISIAQLFGYQIHPNYKGPTGADGTMTLTLIQAISLWIGAAVMAPASEEAIFRGSLQKGLSKLARSVHLGAFIVPAMLTSIIFVALHETSDPLLFSTRLAHALVLSYVYQKEGILASMAAHGFFNGMLAISLVFTAMGAPFLGLLTIPAAIFFSLKARSVLKAQKPLIDSGALAPIRLSAGLAFGLAALLVLGYLFLMPNIFWAIGAVALAIKGMIMIKDKQA